MSCTVSLRNRRGLTLMELVVVLAILVAVAGILVPMLPNFLHKANVASCTTNIAEIDKIVQTYQGTYGVFPDQVDNLVNGSALPSYVMTGATGEYGAASFEAGTLTADEAASLNNAGIKNVCTITAAPGSDKWSPTAWPYGNDDSVAAPTTALSSTTKVATLTATGARLVGVPYSANYKYVIFGLNKPCTLFRDMATEPPYHFADTPSEDPATWYMCFAVIFQVTREVQTGVDADDKPTYGPRTRDTAKYVGSVAFHEFGLATADAHAKEWWSQLKDDRSAK